MSWQAFFLWWLYVSVKEGVWMHIRGWVHWKSAFLTNNAKSHSWHLSSRLSSKYITRISWFSQPLEVGRLLSWFYRWEVIEESGPQILSCEGSHPLRLAPEVHSHLHKVSPSPSEPSWSSPSFVDRQYFQASSSPHSLCSLHRVVTLQLIL